MSTNETNRAVVTGASSGIGRSVVKELVAEGWTVLAVARRDDRLSELAEEANGKVSPLALDLTQQDAPARIVTAAGEKLGGLDLLVNNAGTSCISSFADMPEDKLDEILDLNVRALMRLTRAAIPLLAQSSHGQVINIASVAARLPMETLAVYCASKAAVVMFTKVLARELAPQKIRVNALSPAGTNTELFEKLGSTLDTSGFITAEDQARMVVALTKLPVGIDVVELEAHQRFNTV